MSSVCARRVLLCAVLAVALDPTIAAGQESAPHAMSMPAEDNTAWRLMQDGVVFGLFNHQGGARGGDEVRVPNWWMGMASKKTGRSQLTLTSMFSLDAATVGARGYREIFQVGEAIDGVPLIDHQHPHDFVMQLAAVWRVGVTDRTGLTLAGGPAGEPALGPVAFMHRASSAENPIAPLGHHTFDSTHIAFGVVTAAVDHGPFVLEGSLFNGREPDQHRWNVEVGQLDSVSTRLWYTPSPAWELQVSTGHLVDPEELEPGNIQRTTASASWMAGRDATMTAVTLGYGVNDTDHGTRQAMFAEATRRRGALATFGRFEMLQPEIDVLTHDAGSDRDGGSRQHTLAAFTAGAVRDVLGWRGFDGALGGAVTVYAVPDVLRSTHGRHPVSFQLFFRLRPRAPMGRMHNMRMSRPQMGHGMAQMGGR